MNDINRLFQMANKMTKNTYYWAEFFRGVKNKSIFFIHPDFIVMSKTAFDSLQKRPKIKQPIIIDDELNFKK